MKQEITRITIDGIEYEAVDTKIKDGLIPTCSQCDIFKARPPYNMSNYPLCYEYGNGKARISCTRQIKKNIHRIWKKVKK